MEAHDTSNAADTSLSGVKMPHYIRAWRKYRGLTGKEVGDLCDPRLTSSMITQLEKGRSGYSQRSLENIAKVLGVEPWQLLFSEPVEPVENMDDWAIFKSAIMQLPLYREVEEQHRAGCLLMFQTLIGSTMNVARQMFGQPRRSEEEAA